LFNNLTVIENVALGALALGNSKKIAQERAADILEILGIEKLGHLSAGSISHGNARLVGLARAVAAHPKYLIMDEPAAGLNEDEAPRLLHALNNVRESIGCGMLLVEHNVKLVTESCDRVIVLATGVLIFDGAPQEALKNTDVQSAYLGNSGTH
jgi:branched-chain amino acid transport system ATP-binding protein